MGLVLVRVETTVAHGLKEPLGQGGGRDWLERAGVGQEQVRGTTFGPLEVGPLLLGPRQVLGEAGGEGQVTSGVRTNQLAEI